MPPPFILDPERVDPDQVVFSGDQIYQALPQQHEFRQLDHICYYDPEERIAAALREVRTDEWWVRGHIPGRPIFPGVLLLEAAAQLSAYACKYMHGHVGMVGYGGVDDCKFRASVTPPARLILLCREIENRSRRITCDTQAVMDGALIFEARITGLAMPA